jgi:hypothetical protein
MEFGKVGKTAIIFEGISRPNFVKIELEFTVNIENFQFLG